MSTDTTAQHNGADQEMNAPEHLIWQLSHFNNHQRAIKFVQQFQDTLCVFSGPVSQLYTNYEISVPEADDRSLIILPNPYAYHDTFNGIPEESVRPTGITIIPDEQAEKEGLLITLPMMKDGKRIMRPVPLKAGLWALMKRSKEHEPFLPVITKGDLRAFRKDAPCLHLHRIVPARLTERSKMEVSSIQRVIREKLNVYL